MKLIWHIIRKDLLRDRWALLLWAGLFVAQAGLGLAISGMAADKETIVKLQLAAAALVGLQVVMGYILVARWVQADALLGTELFWVTRPISRARLLAAKGLGGLLIFGLLPAALLLPWWLYNGLGARDIFWLVVETFGWQLLVITPAFLVASLTDDLGRVLLWTLLLVIGLLSWMIMLQSVNIPRVSDASNALGFMLTRIWVLCLLAVASSGIVVAHHYLTRRVVRSVVLVYLGLGLIVLVGQFWVWDWSKAMAGLARPAPVPPAGLVEGMSLQAGRAWVAVNAQRSAEKTSSLRMNLQVQGLPADMSIIAENVVQTWRWPGSPVFKRTNQFGMARFPAASFIRRTLALPAPVDDPETVRWYQALRDKETARLETVNAERASRGLDPIPYPSFTTPRNDGLSVLVYAVLPDTVIAKMRQESPAYTVWVDGAITRPALMAELPLRLGARTSGDSRTFRLVHLLPLPEKDYEATAAVVVATEPVTRKSGLWLAGEARRDTEWLYRSEVMDVNRTTGDVSRLNNTKLGEVRIGGIVLVWQKFAVHPFTLIRNGHRVLKDPQWRDHTTLAMLAEKPVARFTRELKTDRLELEPESPKVRN